MENFIVSARKYRPQEFDTVVGQSHVTDTLEHAIENSQLAQALLFCGPRGVGKTTCARILARKINEKDGSTSEDGFAYNIFELDAASNNSVDDIRDLTDQVRFAPQVGKYKIYIIDEVHMLSTAAFNAFLKTLEEPPKHVIFILATTEPHKIPATIISRTQRFDFKRIGLEDIVGHLKYILDQKNISYEDAAVKIVARSAEGGMRDALSILDQALSFSEETLTVNDALEVTGSLTNDMMDQYLSYCINHETEKALDILNQLLRDGKESNRIVENLLLYCRDLLMHKQAPVILEKQVGYVTDTFKKLSEEVTVEKLYELINELNETQKEIRFSYQPTVFLEVMTVKLSTSSLASSKTSELSTSEIGASNEDNSYLLEKINQLELEVHSLKEKGIQVSRQEATQSNAPKKAKASTYRIPTEQVYQVLEKAKKDQLIAVKGAWQELLQFLSVTQRAMIKASEPVAASEDSLVIAFDYEILCQKASQDEELAIAMRHGFERLLRYSPNFISVPKEQWTELRQSFISQMDTSSTPGEEKQVQSDPVVDEAKELFGSFVNIIED